MATTVNVLISSSGLGLPSTLAVPFPGELPVSSLANILSDRLPRFANNLVLSSESRRIDPTSSQSLANLSHGSDLLALDLSCLVLGGKGGFGSQLRAAGGRMASRKNRDKRDQNGSNRDLNGRRLRTIADAKNIAQYLATKPDMDKKEKEEKRRRWESIVEAADRREEEINSGKKGTRLDGEWVEQKEEAEGKTRDAVLAMMKAGLMDVDGPTGSESEEDEDEDSESPAEGSGSSGSTEEAGTRNFFGWDEDELSDDEDDIDDVAEKPPAYEGKGKGSA